MESQLGRYTVLKHLASGGMADVLLGRTDGIEGFQRHVVLKRIRPELARDPRFVRMFLDEARLAASLHHQNIVHVHDVGEAAGGYFLAMEYLHGQDLRTILAAASRTRQHIPLGHVLAIVAAAAAGLHYAHERRGADNRPLGIVHRDVSPSNLLVGYDGSIKVVDFGIAKAAAQDDTRSGSLRGKITYLSPEQCKGERVDRRTDVYGLGVVLYELATTTRLFKGDNDYRVMEAIVQGRVPAPRVRRPDLPEELSAIIVRALAPDPERRYFTADELRVALDHLARKLGLVSSNAAIAAYMRKQFGEQPEPWLELGGSFDDFERPEAQTELAARHTWTELPRSDNAGTSSNSSIPRQTGPLDVARVHAAAAAGAAAPQIVPTPSRPAAMEGHVAAPRRPSRVPARLLMVGAPLLAVAGIALWWMAGRDQAVPAAVASASGHAATSAAPTTSTAAATNAVPATGAAPATRSTATTVASAATPAAAGSTTSTAASSAGVASPTARAATVSAAARSAPPSPSSAAPSARVAGAAPAHPADPATDKDEASDQNRARSRTTSAASKHAAQRVADAAPLPAEPVVAAPVATPPPAPLPVAVAPAPRVPDPPAAPPPAPAAPAAPAAAMPAPVAPANVASTALDANRVAGDHNILPDDSTQVEIKRHGLDRVIGSFKVCIDTRGEISGVSQIKSTGFAPYDLKITTTIRNKWRYRPFLVNGQPSPVCTAVRFIYTQ